ncbi:MAG: hypothetical protein R3Y32_08585 [Bacillota bacterium]
MKKSILILLGIIPFFVGYGINYLVMGPFYNTVPPFTLFGILFLIAWFLFGRYSYKLVDNKKLAIVLGNLVALIVLALILYQEFILGQYWSGFVGIATQFYYLPLIRIVAVFTGSFHTLSPTYIVAFLIMCIVFYFGCQTSKHHTK